MGSAQLIAALWLCAAVPSCAWGAEPPGPVRELSFVARKMTTVTLPVRDPETGAANELYQDVETGTLQQDAGTISVSAWVWSDAPMSAHVRLSDLKGKDTVSAFHSGTSRWEYLTVAYPYDERPALLRLSLLARTGEARFAETKAIALYDDRFTKALPDGCNPLRERATYRNGERIRIVIVGNSTVNGNVLADKRATFPYVLQAKLEAAFPGRFEVVNFGICAWHLPPQIVTLDKVFNINLWCNGAEWCGKYGQFSHRIALASEPNEDGNTPTISELKPDVIIFAGMWNDVWRVLKYAESGLAPNPDEVNRNGRIPASVEYLRRVFKYADHPTRANYDAAEKALRRAMRPLDSSTLEKLAFREYSSLKKSPEFARLIQNARFKFGYLAEEFIRRGQRHAQVWALVLPGRFRDAYEEASTRMQAAGLLSAKDADKFLRNGYIDAVTEEIQSTELARVARKLGAPLLDLSVSYHQQHDAMTLAEQFALGYFLENVEDNVHFTYRGNEWIADQIFSRFMDELAGLKRKAASPTH